MAKRKILIAEDEFIISLTLSKIFSELGYNICEMAATKEEAVATAKKEKPDVVLMDINLGGQEDGIKAAEQINTLLGIPIIYMTGYSDKELMDKAKKTKPIACFIKPVEIIDLQMAIESVYE